MIESKRANVTPEALAKVALHTDNLVIITDTHGCIVWVNQGFTQITEYTLDEVYGKRPESVLRGSEASQNDKDSVVWTPLEDAKRFNVEILNQTKSGKQYWLAVELQTIASENDQPRLIILGTDVTERKRAVQALEMQNKRLRRLYEISTQAKLQVEEQIRLALGMACESLKVSRAAVSQVQGDRLLRIYQWSRTSGFVSKSDKVPELGGSPREQSQSGIEALGATLEGRIWKGNRLVDSSHLTEDESFAFSDFPYFIGIPLWVGGKRFGALLFCGETTDSGFTETDQDFVRLMGQWVNNALERRMVEADWERAKAESDRMAREVQAGSQELRDALKKNEALIQETEQAAKLKTEFLTFMSHEVRTPINGITGMADLLMDSGLDSDQKDSVRAIQSCAEDLLNIVNDVLNFSKIEAGKMELEEREFSLRDLVEDSVDLFGPSAAAKGLEINSFIDNTLPQKLVGDPTRLRQILVNLINNAIKFSQSGEAFVLVGADPAFKGRRSDAENGRIGLRFSVWDTGPGIPKDRISKLFQPYSQLDASVFRTHGGSGLGLVISQQLASLLGGRVWVESEEGKGATFHFTVVMKRTSQSAIDVSENDADRMPSSEELKGHAVLIFSSHRSNENLLKSYLTSWGMKVAHTNSVSQMMKWLSSSSVDKIPWVIVDTPNRLDLQAVDFLRPFFSLIEAAPQRRWIALTSQVSAQMKDALKLHSNARWISKPIKPRTLLSGFVYLLKGTAVEVESDKSSAVVVETKASASVNITSSLSSDQVKDPSRQLLLVEDNPVNQKIAMRALERAGWQVDVAADGESVKSWLLSKRYRVALVDLWLPGMNGHEVVRFIRSSIPKPQQPLIVALTAHSSEEEKQKCLESGMDAFMTKPIKTAELELTLNDLESKVQI